MLIAEGLQNLYRVIADAHQPQPFGAKRLYLTLQLDELRPAVRSPVRRAEEDDHGPLGTHDGPQRLNLSCLVLEADIGDTLADLGAELRKVDLFAWSGRDLKQRR